MLEVCDSMYLVVQDLVIFLQLTAFVHAGQIRVTKITFLYVCVKHQFVICKFSPLHKRCLATICFKVLKFMVICSQIRRHRQSFRVSYDNKKYCLAADNRK